MPNTTVNWNSQLRHSYSAKAGTSTRINYGEHVRYGGIVKVAFKHQSPTDTTSASWKSIVTSYTQN